MENAQKTGASEKTQANIYEEARINAATAAGDTRWLGWLPWIIVAFALALRLAWLGMKPPHFDEGVNGWFVDQMTRQGYYHYDPGNYHGPFHFYVLFLAQTLFGRNVVVLRVPLVLINVATIWLVLHFQRFIPRRACILAALAFTVSTGMLFYSRYSIHEAWLLFGMILSVWGIADMWTRGTERGLWCVAMGVTLMILTKETYLIHLVAFGLAIGTLWFLELFSPSKPQTGPVPQQWSQRALFNAVATSFLLILFFYSGGFLDPKSLLGLAQTFAAWFQTGVTGNGHQKPFYYWLKLMGLYEWPAAIGFLYSLRAIMPGMNRLTRLLAIYGCGTLVAYGIVPYKTPWCIISIIWPFLFLFGEAFDELAAIIQRKWPAPVATAESAALPVSSRHSAIALLPAALLIIASLAGAVRLNYIHPTDPSEPYVYVQTLNDLFKLTKPLEQVVKRDPTAYHMPINILLSSYHPLPWVLGEFTSVGYYEKAKVQPPTMDAGFILADEDRIADVEAALQQPYFVESFQLRDAMAPGKLYLSYIRFAAIFPGRTPEFIPSVHSPGDASNAKGANIDPSVTLTLGSPENSPVAAQTTTAPANPVQTPTTVHKELHTAAP